MLPQKTNVSRLRRVGGRTVSLPRSPGLAPDIVEFVEAQFASLYKICKKHRIPIPAPPAGLRIPLPVSVKTKKPKKKKPTLSRARRLKMISDRSRNGWITRKAVAQIMTNIPGITKAAALAIHEVDHPRTRIGILTIAEAKTPGEKRWVGRVKNIQDNARDRGEEITWEAAHQRALNDFQHPRPRRRRRAA